MQFFRFITSCIIVALLWDTTVQKQNQNSYANNVYILLSASKFYFNYRHTLNVMIMYKYLKENGITDDQILLMLPTDHGCSPKNPFPGTLYHTHAHDFNWLCDDIEVDYKAEDLTADTILNMMRGRYEDFYPLSKKLHTNSDSRIFMYFNGHGGENFFKIQDTDLIHSEDLAKVFNEMHIKGLYKELFMILDTCEAESMFHQVDAPNLFLLSSALNHESAIADVTDGTLNTFLSDKFSQVLGEFLFQPNGYKTRPDFKIGDFPRFFTYDKVKSHVGVKSTSDKQPSEVLFKDYFPTNKMNEITLGEGIDGKQDDTKFFNWDDLLQ